MANESAAFELSRGLESEVARAKAGDRDALESVVRAVQKDIYRMALRFLWHPQDAEDATQEILIRIVTGLASFNGDSGFRTWVYRVACNTLISLRKKGRMERQSLTFDAFGEDLAQGLSDDPLTATSDSEQAVLLEEVKIGCTLAMLMCLDRDHRLAYIVGEILELDHQEGAEVLEITPATYRKRLSRARAQITSFMMSRCGLANPDNACRCRRRVARAIELCRVDPKNLLFASSSDQARRFPDVVVSIRQLEATRRAAALYRSHPDPKPPEALVSWLKTILDRDSQDAQ